jgi:hypothetical protein
LVCADRLRFASHEIAMAEVAIDKADPVATGPAPYSVVAGAIAAAAVSSVLMAFGTGIGLSTASPSVTWRDTSSALALLSGIWILLVALGSFALGGYLAGRMRSRWADAAADEIEFRAQPLGSPKALFLRIKMYVAKETAAIGMLTDQTAHQGAVGMIMHFDKTEKVTALAFTAEPPGEAAAENVERPPALLRHGL